MGHVFKSSETQHEVVLYKCPAPTEHKLQWPSLAYQSLDLEKKYYSKSWEKGESWILISRELVAYFGVSLPSLGTRVWGIKLYFPWQENGLTGIQVLWGITRASSEQLPKLNKLNQQKDCAHITATTVGLCWPSPVSWGTIIDLEYLNKELYIIEQPSKPRPLHRNGSLHLPHSPFFFLSRIAHFHRRKMTPLRY